MNNEVKPPSNELCKRFARCAHWRDELLIIDPTPVQVTDGYLELPTTPGLGIDLDEKAIAKSSPEFATGGVSSHARQVKASDRRLSSS